MRKAGQSKGQTRDDVSAQDAQVNGETVNELVVVATAEEELLQGAEAVGIHSFNNEVLDEDEEGDDEDQLFAEQIPSKKDPEMPWSHMRRRQEY
jgi:hypothetical protein